MQVSWFISKRNIGQKWVKDTAATFSYYVMLTIFSHQISFLKILTKFSRPILYHYLLSLLLLTSTFVAF